MSVLDILALGLVLVWAGAFVAAFFAGDPTEPPNWLFPEQSEDTHDGHN